MWCKAYNVIASCYNGEAHNKQLADAHCDHKEKLLINVQVRILS